MYTLANNVNKVRRWSREVRGQKAAELESKWVTNNLKVRLNHKSLRWGEGIEV